MAQVRIQHSFDTEENWTTENPVLRAGEMVLSKENDGSLKLVVGDKENGVNYSEAPVVWSNMHENIISHRRHLWREGRLNFDDGTEATTADDDVELLRRYHLHSILFDIEPNTVYTAKAWSKECRGYFLFFDADKQFIPESGIAPTYLELQAGYTFTTPATAKYIAVDSYLPYSIPTSSSYAVTSMNDLGWKHLYKVEKGTSATEFTPSRRDAQEAVPFASNERPKNDPEAARQLVSCAESYKGKGWVYGQDMSNHDTYTTDGPPAEDLLDSGIKQIDCQTLMVLALNGIPYYQSKYFDNSLPWRGVHYYPWGKYPNHIWIEGFSLWCYYNGWEVDPGINFSKLQAGDLVFYGKIDYPADSISGWRRQFRYIDHVAMFTGRWVADPNRNNELHPQSIEVLQSQPIVQNNFIDRVSASGKEIKMIIRMPLETPYGEYDSEINTDGVFYSSYYKPSVSAVGNGQPLKIDIYGRNFAIFELGGTSNGVEVDTNRKRFRSAGYLPFSNSQSFKTTIRGTSALTDAGFTSPTYLYYDADLNYLGTDAASSNDVAYVKYTIKKPAVGGVDPDITQQDLDAVRPYIGAQRYGRDTVSSSGKYPPGFHSWAYLDTVIPDGARLDRHHGKYAYTTDGMTWIDLPEGDQIKLNSLRVADGENNVYIAHGQKVKLMHQDTAIERNELAPASGLYLAFGDSITYGYPIPEEVPHKTAYTYVDAIGKAVGVDEIINKARPGQGLLTQATNNPQEIAEETLAANENLIAKASLITLDWGKNDRNQTLGTSSDASTANTICGKWKKCLDYIKTKNKFAQIIIISSIKQANKGWDENLGTGNWSLDDLETQVGAIAAAYNIPYITWRKCSIINNLSTYTTDYIHPTSFAYKHMGAYIAGQVSQYFKNVWDL